MVDHRAWQRWPKDDHVDAGFDALMTFGRPRDLIRTASAGHNALGEQQVLMIGRSHVEIWTGEGDLLLDAGTREIRAIRSIEGSGVEVWVTQFNDSEHLRQPCWLHKVSNQAARYLEETWLHWAPNTHSGIVFNPLHWREDEYAYAVGRAITEAARCEISLEGLAVAGLAFLGRPTDIVWGRSGEPLADHLDRLGKHSRAIADIAERYRAWMTQRNFLVHGARGYDSSGHATDQVFKTVPTSQRRDNPAEIFVERTHDFRQVARLWHAFYMLNRDAGTAAVGLGSTGNREHALRDLPMPSSVSDEQRLPASPLLG